MIIYLDKIVYINLLNGYYYTGKCISADEDSITIIDKNDNAVSLSKESISSIREVRKE